jgi:hypothetical protein
VRFGDVEELLGGGIDFRARCHSSRQGSSVSCMFSSPTLGGKWSGVAQATDQVSLLG